MSEKGIWELAKDKFACYQCHGSRRVITIGGIKAECKACRGFGTWGIKIEEIIAFAESIVEQCAQVADEAAVNSRRMGDNLAGMDHNKLADKAIMCAQEADKIAAAIRSRWQRGEGQG